MLLLVVLLPGRLVSGDIVLVRVRDNAKIPFFRLLGAELHLGFSRPSKLLSAHVPWARAPVNSKNGRANHLDPPRG